MKEIIKEVPAGNYTGYYWLSNSDKPVPVSNNFPVELLKAQLPFTVEGNLWDEATRRSISIRHNGREHIIVRYDLNNLQGFEKKEVSFITHRLPGKERAKFWELWQEEPDELCLALKSLKPYGRAFIGFEISKENN